MMLVRTAMPSLYDLVMTYTAEPDYRSGVRIDFAVFSIFWYALPHAAGAAGASRRTGKGSRTARRSIW